MQVEIDSAFHVGFQDVSAGLPMEQPLTANAQMHHGSKTEEVNQLIVLPSVQYFWRQIPWSARQFAQSTLRNLNGCTTITQYEAAGGVDQNIVGFDITVHVSP